MPAEPRATADDRFPPDDESADESTGKASHPRPEGSGARDPEVGAASPGTSDRPSPQAGAEPRREAEAARSGSGEGGAGDAGWSPPSVPNGAVGAATTGSTLDRPGRDPDADPGRSDTTAVIPPAPSLDPTEHQPAHLRNAPDQPGRQRPLGLPRITSIPGLPRVPGLRRRADGEGRRRGPARGLRVRQRLWKIDPWSVFKVSALFYLCLFLILMVAGALLWNVGRSTGTIDQFESFVTRLGAYGRCVPEDDVPAGAPFEIDEDCPDGEVLAAGFRLGDGTIFRAAAIGGVVLVIAGSAGNVLLTVLLNLINEVSGGTRYTIIRESAPSSSTSSGRPPGAPPGRPPGPGSRGSVRSPEGSTRAPIRR